MKKLILILTLLLSMGAVAQNLRPARDPSTKKYGYQNSKRRWVVPAKYDEATRFRDGFATIKLEGLVGLVDEKGRVLFYPQFDRIEKWENDKALVLYNGHYGLINKKGQMLVKPAYDEIGKFTNDIALVRLNKKWGFINSMGIELAEPMYDEIGLFVNGQVQNIAMTRIDERYGLITSSGKVLVEPKYTEIEPFVGKNQAIIRDGKLYGVLEENGTELCQPVYVYPFDFNGLGIGCNGKMKNGFALFGFMKSDFKEITPFNKLSIIREDDRFYVMEPGGEACIYNPRAEKIMGGFKAFKPIGGRYVNGNYIAVKNNGKWGFCDKNGTMLIECKYDNVGSDDGKAFSQGFCCVTIGHLRGFINEQGNMVISPRFPETVESFTLDRDKNLFAMVEYRGSRFFVKPDGSMICDGVDSNAEWTWSAQLGLISHSSSNVFPEPPAGLNWILGRWVVADEYQTDTGKVQGNKTGRVVYDFVRCDTIPDGRIYGALWITRRGKMIADDGSVVYRGETTVHDFDFNGAEIVVDGDPMPIYKNKGNWNDIKIDDKLNSPQYVHILKMLE